MQSATPGTPIVRQSPNGGAAPGPRAPQSRTPSASSVLLNSAQAAREVFGCSERQFHNLRNQPWFTAKPRVLGPRTIRWARHELEAVALNAPAAQDKLPEPPTLLRGKIERLKRGPSPDAGQASATAVPTPTKPSPALAAVPA